MHTRGSHKKQLKLVKHNTSDLETLVKPGKSYLYRGEGSVSLKTALETKGKTA